MTTPTTNFAARVVYANSPRNKGDWCRYVATVEKIRRADVTAAARRAAEIRADKIRNLRLINLDPTER